MLSDKAMFSQIRQLIVDISVRSIYRLIGNDNSECLVKYQNPAIF